METTTAFNAYENETSILPTAHLDAVDLVVIIVYFVLILAVGVWVSNIGNCV